MPKRTHGGRREGAGRPPLGDERGQEITVYLPRPLIERLRQLGGGNVSAGIRRLAEQTPAADERTIER